MKRIIRMSMLCMCFSLLWFLASALTQTAPRAIVSWNAVTTDMGGNPITGVTYNVYRGIQSTGSDLVKLNSSPITLLTYTDTTVTATGVYYFSASAVTSTGLEGNKAAPVRFSFADVQPATVTGVTVK